MTKRLIEQLHMTRIPQEGPWFTLTYVGKDRLPGSELPARYHGRDHAGGSAIYAVLTGEDFSALHRLQTDETWHFYGGGLPPECCLEISCRKSHPFPGAENESDKH